MNIATESKAKLDDLATQYERLAAEMKTLREMFDDKIREADEVAAKIIDEMEHRGLERFRTYDTVFTKFEGEDELHTQTVPSIYDLDRDEESGQVD